MTEKSIPFKSPMVRAILDGRKTQTRRVLKGANHAPGMCFDGIKDWCALFSASTGGLYSYARLPYVEGDILWVREAHVLFPRNAYDLPKTVNPNDPDMAAYYRVDFDRSGKIKWRPTIHMHRWASRITLEVTAVKVERLQDISAEDAEAEGLPTHVVEHTFQKVYRDAEERDQQRIKCFKNLWDGIHGADAWEKNPWVAAISFERVK